jgi:hypothetical protein
MLGLELVGLFALMGVASWFAKEQGEYEFAAEMSMIEEV